MNIYPYVYRGTHPTTGEFYIGMRYANKHPAEQDLSCYYKTSSNIVKPRFNEFNWTVLAEFFTKEAAFDFEQELIHENFGSPSCLNKSCMFMKQHRFIQDDAACERISKALTGRKRTPEHNANNAAARRRSTSQPGGYIAKHKFNRGRRLSDEQKQVLKAAINKRPDETRHHYNNGTRQFRLYDDDPRIVDEGLIRGMLPRTLEHTMKLAQTSRGRAAHNKGQRMSEEQRLKISLAQKAAWENRKSI